MDGTLESSATGYSNYRQLADRTAEPIEAQRYLQSLPLTTNGPNGGMVTLTKVNAALDRLEKGKSMPGPHPAKSVTNETMQQLYALQADLERETNRDLGKAKGSPTSQLLTSQAEMGAEGIPLLAAQHAVKGIPLVGLHIAGALGNAGETANKRVMVALANRLIHPEPLPALPEPSAPSRVAQTGRRVAAALPGTAGGVILSRLLGR